MSTRRSESKLEGRTVYASDGEKLGKIDSVLVDDSGKPLYAEVKSGWFGSRRHTVPVSGLSPDGDDLTAAYTKEQLESAPTFDEGEEIDYDRERAIGSHYGTDVRDWDDDRDRWLAGEDLSRGPTPETRHPDGGLDDVRDTTQGPTPETRQAMRVSDDDAAASGQPEADARTREGATTGTGRDVSGPTTNDARDAGRVRLRKVVEGDTSYDRSDA
jgi:hypothetical protein